LQGKEGRLLLDGVDVGISPDVSCIDQGVKSGVAVADGGARRGDQKEAAVAAAGEGVVRAGELIAEVGKERTSGQ
jgi:hypothetical protein